LQPDVAKLPYARTPDALILYLDGDCLLTGL